MCLCILPHERTILIFDNEKVGLKSDYFLEASFPVPKFRRLFLIMPLLPTTDFLKSFVTGTVLASMTTFPQKKLICLFWS